MISKITPKFIQKINSTPKKIVPRHVEISTKNGKDYVRDVYVGGVPRVSIVEIIQDIFGRFLT